MIPRTLHSANAVMYAAIALLVVAADVYVWCTESNNTARCIAATVATLMAVIWALHYVVLRYRIDAAGVSEHRLFRKVRRIRWSELSSARLEEVQLQGIAGLTIILESPETTLSISSSILHMEAVEELAEELKNVGILP